jgi:hypothetical protein
MIGMSAAHTHVGPKLDMVVALLSRTTAAGGCKCAPFDDLRDTPRALHLANVMVRGPTDSTSPVAVFDGSILATVAVSAPHVMVKTAGAVLDGFGDLPEVDRRMLYETFRVWLDNDALVVGHPVIQRRSMPRAGFHPASRGLLVAGLISGPCDSSV